MQKDINKKNGNHWETNSITNGKIVVLASGRGSNLQALMDYEKHGRFQGSIIAVISDKKNAFALNRALEHGCESLFFPKRSGETAESYSIRIAKKILYYLPDVIVLAGFMKILHNTFFSIINQPVINIHPSLLPSFGGEGMYGERVHQAVIAAGEKISGCTAHLVTPAVDQGPIILQSKVQVDADDTWETLSQKVLALEHKTLPEAVKLILEKSYFIKDNQVIFTDNDTDRK